MTHNNALEWPWPHFVSIGRQMTRVAFVNVAALLKAGHATQRECYLVVQKAKKTMGVRSGDLFVNGRALDGFDEVDVEDRSNRR
jgi:hypothetical protein